MIAQSMGLSLRMLSRVARSPLTEKLGLSGVIEEMLYRGTQATNEAAKKARPVIKLLTPQRMGSASGAGLFDLTLTEEQELVRDTMNRFAKEQMRPAALEADENSAPPLGFLQAAHELGLNQLAVPEALDGAGEERSITSNVLILEDLSRGDMALALAALAPLGVVHALVDFGTAKQQGAYLPAFVGDEFYPAALALLEPQPLFDPHKPLTRAHQERGEYVIRGTKSMVPLAQSAEVFLVVAQCAGRLEAFLVDKGTPGLHVESEPTMGLRAAQLGRLELRDVRVPLEARLGEQDGIDGELLIDLARIAWGALCVGTCDAVLDYVKEYIVDRHAFGEPIAHRQSVAFMAANIALEVDAMRLMVYRAAARAERGKSFRREAALARIHAAEHGMQIGTDGVQLLGGHGYTKEHPVERWYRHLRAIGVVEGGLLV